MSCTTNLAHIQVMPSYVLSKFLDEILKTKIKPPKDLTLSLTTTACSLGKIIDESCNIINCFEKRFDSTPSKI